MMAASFRGAAIPDVSIFDMFKHVMGESRRAVRAAFLVALIVLACGWDAARGQDRVTTVARPARATCQRSAFRVVVDVGHTPEVPGAISARGVPEYAFNLQLATEIRQALVAAGFVKTVLLITTTAPLAGLTERADRANDMRADLFLAVHHDSVPDYLLETWEFEGKENHFSDRFTGYALFVSNDNADRAGSLRFGHFLGKALQRQGLRYTPHYTSPLMGHRRRELLDAEAGVYRYDQLIVLRSTHMPALLMEAGSIINRQEELQMATPERRALVAAAVAAAVGDFCTAQAQRRDARR